MTLFPPQLLDGAAALLDGLRKRDLRIATAESCTGGLLCGLLTEVPGASDSVERGFVTYSNDAKSALLGVEPVLIEREGAVSDAVARAMAEGALAHAPVDVAIAVTGIAGPSGGTESKPVGLVYLAVAIKGRPTEVREYRFGDLGRTAIRLATLEAALAMARTAVGAAE